MEESDYFDKYSPQSTPQPEKSGENAENPDVSEISAGKGSPDDPDSAAISSDPINRPELSSEQLGYSGPRMSPGKRLVLAAGKAVGYFAIYFGIEFVIAGIFGFIWYAQVAERAESAAEAERLYNELWNARSMALMIVIDLIFLALTALIFVLRRNNSLSRRQNLGLRNPVPAGRLGMIFAIGVTLNYAITIPLAYLEALLPEETVNDYAQTQAVYDSGGLLVYIISGVILAPIVEELVFRGLVSTRLSRAMPAGAALLIAATGFGAIHGTLIQGLYAGLLGVLLGVVFFRENSLIASIALHFGFNLASLLPYILSQNEQLAESESVNALYANLCLLCIPICVVLMICYFIIQKKRDPARPGEPEVNGWLMRE